MEEKNTLFSNSVRYPIGIPGGERSSIPPFSSRGDCLHDCYSATETPEKQQKTRKPSGFPCFYWRRHPDSNWGIKILQTFALPLGYGAVKNGAVDEARTRDLHLGKVALYQLSYYRTLWCLGAESNHRHANFQSAALPTELPRQIWRPGRGSNPRPPA